MNITVYVIDISSPTRDTTHKISPEDTRQQYTFDSDTIKNFIYDNLITNKFRHTPKP